MTTYTRFIVSGRDGYEWNDTTDTEAGQDGPERVNTLTIGDTWLTIRGPVSTLRIPARDAEQVLTWNDSIAPCGHVYEPTEIPRGTIPDYADRPCVRDSGHPGLHLDRNGDKWVNNP